MRDIDPLPVPQTEPESLDYKSQFTVREGRRLLTQGALHYSGQVANLLSSLVLVPILLLKLGTGAYGFWIVTLAAPAFLAGLDNAFSLSVTRETAGHRNDRHIGDEETVKFLTACLGAFIVVGLAGGAIAVVAATGIVRNLHLDPVLRAQAPVVIIAVALAFAAGRAWVFGSAVLAGFNRFGTINAISIGALAIRFAGFVVLLERDTSLGSIASWYCLVALLEGVIAVLIAHRLGAVRVDRSFWNWALLRRAGSFGIWSLLTTEVLNLGTYGPAFLLSLLTGGTAATTVLYTGQRPGLIISEFNWRGGDVMFAASAAKMDQDDQAMGTSMMQLGTAGILAVAIPLSAGLFILAPAIVSVWLRVAQPEIVTVMRLTAVGIIADALLVSPMHILWGRGMARKVLVIASGITVSILSMNAFLILRMGAVGSAIAFSASTWLGAIAVTIAACRELNASAVRSLLVPILRFALPTILLVTCTYSLSLWLRETPRLLLVTAVTCGGVVYAGVFAAQEHMRNRVRNR